MKKQKIYFNILSSFFICLYKIFLTCFSERSNSSAKGSKQIPFRFCLCGFVDDIRYLLHNKAPFSFIIAKAKEKIKSYYLTVSKSRRLFFHKLAELFYKVLAGDSCFFIAELFENQVDRLFCTAAERLFEFLLDEIQLAVDDEWDIEDLSATIDKYNI